MKTCNKDFIKEKVLPKGWEMRKLGEVCGFQRGLTYSGKDAVDFSNNVVLRSTNIDLDNNCLNFTELKYLNNDFKIKDNKKLVKGALLICLSSGSKSHLGKVALVDDNYDYAYGGFIGQIIPSQNICSKYLFYNLISNKYKSYISGLTDGININNLKSNDLKDFEIPLPTLPEQKRIVAILDQAFDAINKAKANTEQNLKNAHELFQSKLQETFDNGKLKIENGEWEEKKLGEVCEVIAGQSPEGKYYNSEKNGLPFYQGKKEFSDKFIGEPVKWTTKVTKEAEENDILMSVRAPVGPINFSTQKICIGRGLAAIRAKELIDKEFLFNFLLKNENEIVGNAGAVFNSINKKQIEDIKIPLPPLPEQKRIVKKLDALSTETKKLETIYQQKIDDLDELKKSILQQAFSGEL